MSVIRIRRRFPASSCRRQREGVLGGAREHGWPRQWCSAARSPHRQRFQANVPGQCWLPPIRPEPPSPEPDTISPHKTGITRGKKGNRSAKKGFYMLSRALSCTRRAPLALCTRSLPLVMLHSVLAYRSCRWPGFANELEGGEGMCHGTRTRLMIRHRLCAVVLPVDVDGTAAAPGCLSWNSAGDPMSRARSHSTLTCQRKEGHA